MPAKPDDLRKLKQPFGILIPDSKVTIKAIGSAIRNAKLVVTVGDATTERLVTFGMIPDIAVIDGMERRTMKSSAFKYSSVELRCSNPRGSISSNAIAAIRRAVTGVHPVRILVDGEEDLLALPLFYLVPRDSVVLYGQPLEGLVFVRTTAQKQKEAIDLMKRISDIPDLSSSPENESRDSPSANGPRRKSKSYTSRKKIV